MAAFKDSEKHQETRFEIAEEEQPDHDTSLHQVATQDTEKASSYANSTSGLAHKAETAKAERKLLLKLGALKHTTLFKPH